MTLTHALSWVYINNNSNLEVKETLDSTSNLLISEPDKTPSSGEVNKLKKEICKKYSVINQSIYEL